MSKHPRNGRKVLVHDCYGDFFTASYDTEYREWDTENGRVNNEKLWHYVWTELPEVPGSSIWLMGGSL